MINKKIKNNLIWLGVVFLVLFFNSFIFSFVCAESFSTEEIIAAHQTGELLVKLKNSEKVYKFKFADDKELLKLIDYYQNNTAVDYVEPNYIYQASSEPSDTFFSQQLYLSIIKAIPAWDITVGSAQVTIAVLDTGVDINHPDLKDNIWTNFKEVVDNGIDDDENGYTDDVHGWDFLTNSKDVLPKVVEPYSKVGVNHGTVVAGIAAARGHNGEGIAGVTWNSKIMPLRVLDSAGLGATDKVAEAIDYAVKQGAQIINLSFVGHGRSLTLENAIKRAYEAGVLVVAAAGNEVSNGLDLGIEANLSYPVCHDGPNGENWVLGVSSVDNDNVLTSFSNYGSRCVDLVAPGVRLFSTTFYQNNSYEFGDYYQLGFTGTSVSAPQVAGALALIKAIKPNLSIMQMQEIILNSAHNVDNQNPNYKGKLGKGLLDVYAAVSAAVTETPTTQFDRKKILTAAGVGGGPHVKVLEQNNLKEEFFAFDNKFRGGLSLASGDLDNDGKKEIVVGLGKGTYPWVKIFSENGNLEEQSMIYNQNFRGGLEVAVGDTDADGVLEIITGPGTGGGPDIKVFDYQGHIKGSFMAFDKKFRGGVFVAAGDVNGDGRDEIIVAPMSGFEPWVKIFDQQGNLLTSFLAFDVKFRQGVRIAAGDVNGDGRDEIIVGAGKSDTPQVRIFNFKGELLSNFLAFDKKFRGGVFVAAGDINGDSKDEIITGAGVSGGPQVRVFDLKGELQLQFFAYDSKFRGGVRVAAE